MRSSDWSSDVCSSDLGVVGDRYRDGPDRHRSLRAAVEWTIAQLDRPARRLFERLGVVEGSFDLEDAELLAEGIAEDPLDAVEAMVDLHLVETAAAPSPAGRLRLPPSIKAVALPTLSESGEAAAAGEAWRSEE